MLYYLEMESWRSIYFMVYLSISNMLMHVGEASIDAESAIALEVVLGKDNVKFSSFEEPVTATKALVLQDIATATPQESQNFSVVCSNERFIINRESILNYFLRMATCDVMEDTNTRMKSICQNKTFSYNEYYNVTYLVACHQKQFQQICNADKFLIPWTYTYEEKSGFHEEFIAHNSMELMTRSCKSVKEFLRAFQRQLVHQNAAIDFTARNQSNRQLLNSLISPNGKMLKVEYSEWYVPTIPFCRNFACGASKWDHATNQTSVYYCMPLECRGIVTFVMIFDAIVAVLIIVANCLVLGVAARTRIMRNIPGYFKISLALADLAVGVFVLPSCIYVTYVVYLGPMPYRGPGHKSSIADYISEPVAHFIGIFVVISFAVSVYTMAVASIDRYLAITKPFEYRQGHYLTKRRSVWAFAFIWLIAFFIAGFPAFSNERFAISAFNVVLSTGANASMVYAATLFLPLIAVWGLNGAMLKQVCSDREKRSTIRARSSTVSTSIAASDYDKQMPGITRFANEQRFSSTDGKTTNESANTASNGYQKNEKSIFPSSKEGVFEKIKRKRSRMSSAIKSRKSLSRKSSFSKSVNVERRLARTLAIMIGAFTIALLPCIATLVAFAILASDSTPTTENHLASALYVASRILFSNSFWNCIIYSLRNAHFRRAMWAIFLCKKKRIERRLRESLSMTHWKKQNKGQSCSGTSMNDKQSLSKSNSNSSNSATNYRSDLRRSTQMWSFTSQSMTSSQKSSNENVPNCKQYATRTMSCSQDGAVTGILKKPVERSESAPQQI